MTLNDLVNFLKKYYLYTLGGVLIFIIVGIVILILNQPKFSVVETDPKNNQTNVYPGEIVITFILDKQIQSQQDFRLQFNPPLPYSWKLLNTFPTNQLKIQILGGLQTNTKYQVTIFDSNNRKAGMITFTTSNKQAESSSALIAEEEQDYLKKNFPLYPYTPYKTNDFELKYASELTLTVKVKIKDLNKVKREVEEWIRSKGVDPSTHKINYVTQ